MFEKKYKVGILGATGTVGQRFIVLLQNHPFFVIHALGASERSAGKKYLQAVNWKLASPPPTFDLVVQSCISTNFRECDFVFSGLDADVAGPIETEFAENGVSVFTNAKNHRRGEKVPLVIPTLNSHHLEMIRHQDTHKKQKSFIIANTNCATAGLAIPIKAIKDAFGPVKEVSVVTMQAISGAGYPGVASLDIFDNVVPFIGGEEDKLEWEMAKVLADYDDEKGVYNFDQNIRVSASCNRVPVLDGHTECVSLNLATPDKPDFETVKKVLREYQTEAYRLGCPNAPKNAIYVFDQDNRPQPRLDRELEGGYSCAVGRVRGDNIFDLRFVVLSHNTVIGAAGASILNAEICVKKGLI